MKNQMNSIVKEQLKIAENALRRAIDFGSNETPYVLGNIVEALKNVDTALFTAKVDELSEKKPEVLFESTDNYDFINMNYNGSHIKGGLGDDVISFGGNL